MLRGDGATARTRRFGLLLAFVIGASAAALVALGNPGNMGVCGACFVRDIAGSLGLHTGPSIFRPEVAGVMLGAFLFALLSRRGIGRAGGYAAARFGLCAFVAIGAMVFLGCPFRLLQRLGGGDLTAWLALPGFVGGVGLAMVFEKRGYSIGKTAPAPLAVGLLGPVTAVGGVVLFATRHLVGPGPGDTNGPPHAPWLVALVTAGVVGVLLSATGFCAISAARQVYRGPRWMLLGAGLLVAGYAAVVALPGNPTFGASPVAHDEWVWNALGIGLAGLGGALAGGCPVRQLVMAGEGNADAMVGVAGLAFGGALAHTLGLASKAATATDPGGSTPAGRVAVVLGFVVAIVYAFGVVRAKAGPPAS